MEQAQADLIDDCELFCASCLYVQEKSEDGAGGFIKFRWNRAQRVLDAHAEDMLRRTGMVRLLVPKARKLGVSTWAGARGYHKTRSGSGLKALVMAHEAFASQNLFEMVDTFHQRCPDDFRPATGKANERELSFPELGSSYHVRTAGGREPGRSWTFHYLHISELAFIPDAEKIVTGAIKAVPNAAGTWIVCESTSNEPSDMWARMVRAALQGKSEFEVCFLAWYLDDTYRRRPPRGWKPPPKWLEYQGQHGIDDDQLYWAFVANQDIATAYSVSDEAPCAPFKHEYPATVEECFEAAGDDMKRIIPLAWIRRAQANWRRRVAEGTRPKEQTSLGVDVAQGGKANSVIAPWYGNFLAELIKLPGRETPDGATLGGQVIQHRRGRSQVIIDGGGGWGGDTHSHLKGQGVPCALWKPTEKSTYRAERGGYRMASKKVEALWKLREALDPVFGDPGIALPPDEPMTEDLIAYTFKLTRGEEPAIELVETKEQIIEKLGRSPDDGDAVVLGWVLPPGSVQAEPDVRHAAQRAQTINRGAHAERRQKWRRK